METAYPRSLAAHLSNASHTALAVILASSSLLVGQTDPRPRFDVTSVKPHPQGTRPGMTQNPGFLSLRGITLKEAMQMAYGLKRFQIEGGAPWMSTDRFDIEATAAGDGLAETTPAGKAKLMEALQVLLEDRFRLKLSRETRTLPLFTLTIAKSGLKIKEGEDLPANNLGGLAGPGLNRLVRKRVPMSGIADALAGVLDAPVADSTGLGGIYSFSVEWRNDDEVSGAVANGETDSMVVARALRDQLGLNLEATKGPVEILTIVSAEKPTAN